jgi:hypothetical protein
MNKYVKKDIKYICDYYTGMAYLSNDIIVLYELTVYLDDWGDHIRMTFCRVNKFSHKATCSSFQDFMNYV